jgi:hypothetical protein
MPKYSVRMYSIYVDEYEVEADSKDEAITLADEYQYVCDLPKPGELERFAGKVEQVTKHEYVDHDDTCVNELDEDENWIE